MAVLGRKKSAAVGAETPLMTVSRTDGAERSAPVEVGLDYEAFAGAYGGSYGSRLRMVQYPSCVLTTPRKKSCATPKPLKSGNDTGEKDPDRDRPRGGRRAPRPSPCSPRQPGPPVTRATSAPRP
ncbi:hypothetical protein SALBM135S_03709 [Streptomyces alboniger]